MHFRNLALVAILCLPVGAAAEEITTEVVGSSGKYFPDEPASCEAAQADALTIAKDKCTRNPGRPLDDGTAGDCTCEQGGFENGEWLCSAPATLACEPIEEPTEPVTASTGDVKLEVKPPQGTDPLQIASYAFKRRGESLPASLLVDRFAEACSAGWVLACDAPKWVKGERYDLVRAENKAETQCRAGDPSSCIIHGWVLEAKAVSTTDGKWYREAAKIYKRYCARKNARACYEYGTILFNNLGVTADPSLGIRRWSQACDLGESAACTVLSKVYRKGLRTAENPGKAVSYAEKACKGDDPAGCLEKAWLGGDAEAILDARLNYCVGGGVSECWAMATSYISGEATEPRPGLTRGLLRAGCELAHAPSCSNAAKMAMKDGDDPDAVDFFRRSCQLGEVPGCSGLTQMMLTDRADGDVRSEQYAFEVACSKGELPAACSALGLALLDENRPADRPRARALLRQSCLDATSPSKPCFVLGDLYETGAGGERDRTLAARYYKWSCAQGWGDACERRGDLLNGGVGVREDDNEAVVMYQAACDSGLAAGCHKAAVLLDEGTNISRDAERALILYQDGCNKKVGDSCARLGWLYLDGGAGQRNEPDAREAFRSAVELGNVEAHRKLSWMMWNGVGGKKDKKKAKALAVAGCKNDDAIACRGAAFQTEAN